MRRSSERVVSQSAGSSRAEMRPICYRFSRAVRRRLRSVLLLHTSSHAGDPRAAAGDRTFRESDQPVDEGRGSQPAASQRPNRSRRTSPPGPTTLTVKGAKRSATLSAGGSKRRTPRGWQSGAPYRCATAEAAPRRACAWSAAGAAATSSLGKRRAHWVEAIGTRGYARTHLSRAGVALRSGRAFALWSP